jgi:hypothetical protein
MVGVHMFIWVSTLKAIAYILNIFGINQIRDIVFTLLIAQNGENYEDTPSRTIYIAIVKS